MSTFWTGLGVAAVLIGAGFFVAAKGHLGQRHVVEVCAPAPIAASASDIERTAPVKALFRLVVARTEP